jgi:hypothetical protein
MKIRVVQQPRPFYGIALNSNIDYPSLSPSAALIFAVLTVCPPVFSRALVKTNGGQYFARRSYVLFEQVQDAVYVKKYILVFDDGGSAKSGSRCGDMVNGHLFLVQKGRCNYPTTLPALVRASTTIIL